MTGEMSESQASNPCSQDSGVDTRSPPPADETTDLMNETEPQGIMEEEFRQASEGRLYLNVMLTANYQVHISI